MTRMVRTLTLSAALLLGGAALASADTLSGRMDRVDAPAKSFSVKAHRKLEQFTLASDAKVLRGGAAISLAEIKPRERVTVEYSLDHGKRVASRLQVGGRTAAAPASAHATERPSPAPAAAPKPAGAAH